MVRTTFQEKEKQQKKSPQATPKQTQNSPVSTQNLVPYLQLKHKEGPQQFHQAVMALQKSRGNQFVGRILQRLKGSSPSLMKEETPERASDNGRDNGSSSQPPSDSPGGTPRPEITAHTPPASSRIPATPEEQAQQEQQMQNNHIASQPGSMPWNELSEEVRTNLALLGWTERKWILKQYPPSWSLLWGQLDPAYKRGASEGPKQKAARLLGFAPQNWNERVRPGKFPPNCAELIGQVAFYDGRERVREDWLGDAMGTEGYYLGYGKKYVQKFTGPFLDGLYSKGTDHYAFTRWSERTRDLLQRAIVRDLVNPYIESYRHIYEVAFESHADSYVRGGLGGLAVRAIEGVLAEGALVMGLRIATGGISSALLTRATANYATGDNRLGPLIDLLRIMFTVELKDLMKPESFSQVVEVIKLLLVQAAQAVWNSSFDIILNPFRDDRARDAVREWNRLGVLGSAPLANKKMLVEYMIRGFTGDADENSILTILNSNTGQVKSIVKHIGYERMCNNFHGSQWTRLRNLFRQSLYPGLSQVERTDFIFELADGLTPEWKEEEIKALMVANPAHLLHVVSRLGYSTLMGEVEGVERDTFRRLLHSHVYPSWSLSSKVSALRWLMGGRTPTWKEEEIIYILRSTSGSSFYYVVGQVGRRSLNWDLTGSRQDEFDRMYD